MASKSKISMAMEEETVDKIDEIDEAIKSTKKGTAEKAPFDFNKFNTNSLSDLNGLFSIFGNA